MADAVMDMEALGQQPEGGEQPQETIETDPQQGASTPENDQGNQESQQQPEKLDGRKGLKAHRDAARAAAEKMLPEHAQAIKEMASNSFRLEEFRQVFPEIDQARQAKSLVDSLGGIEGASKLQERMAGYDTQEAGLESGDPAVLDSFFQDYPEGAATLAGPYLEKLGKVNPTALQEAVAPYALGMLEAAGINGHVAAMADEKDPARLAQMAAQLNDWIKKQVQGVSTIQKPAPKDDKIAKERQALNEEKEKIFNDGVTSKVDASSEPVLASAVDKYSKQYRLNDAQRSYYRDALNKAVVDEMNADKTYIGQVDLHYKNRGRTAESIAQYISGEYNRRVQAKAFPVLQECQKVFGARVAQQSGTGQVKAGGPQTAPGGGPMYVSQRPPDSELDLTKPDSEMNLIRGRAWTKAGKFITWRKTA